MDIREKLVELICRAHHNASCVLGYGGSEGDALEEEARYLLAHGVTVQTEDEKWNALNEAYDLGVDSVLHDHFGLSWNDAAELRKEVKRLQEATKWIPVSEQEEPTENGTYLCHGYWFGSRRKQTETADFFGEWNIANNFILTHWMPLPTPPKA